MLINGFMFKSQIPELQNCAILKSNAPVNVVLSFTLCFKIIGTCFLTAAMKSQGAENTLQLRYEKLVKKYSRLLNVISGSKYCIYEETKKGYFVNLQS